MSYRSSSYDRYDDRDRGRDRDSDRERDRYRDRNGYRRKSRSRSRERRDSRDSYRSPERSRKRSRDDSYEGYERDYSSSSKRLKSTDSDTHSSSNALSSVPYSSYTSHGYTAASTVSGPTNASPYVSAPHPSSSLTTSTAYGPQPPSSSSQSASAGYGASYSSRGNVYTGSYNGSGDSYNSYSSGVHGPAPPPGYKSSYGSSGYSGSLYGDSYNNSSYSNYWGSGYSGQKSEAELFSKPNTGINFDKYQDIKVTVTGYGAPSPIESFDEAKLAPPLLANINLAKYSKPTPVQKHAIPIMLSGRDLMASAQTGSGKTAAFLFPIISMLLQQTNNQRVETVYRGKTYPFALILAPTRELALQIHQEAERFTYRTHIHSVCVYGGAPIGRQIKELGRGCSILIACPGRLKDLYDRGYVSYSRIQYLCLDEADRMLDMGFEPQIREIVERSDMPKQRRTVMFSATFPKEIQKLAADFLTNYLFLAVGRVGSTSDFITQVIKYVEDDDKYNALVDELRKIKGLTLVFVETKRSADLVGRTLLRDGFPVSVIHGDRKQYEREHALAAFKSGRTPILVATSVAARGLDIENVAHVINYDLPGNIDDYVHRIGRTGRAGNTGLATSFYNSKNSNIASELVDTLREAKQEIPSFLQQFARSAGRGSNASRRPAGKHGGARPSGRASGYSGYGSNYGGNYGGYSSGYSGYTGYSSYSNTYGAR